MIPNLYDQLNPLICCIPTKGCSVSIGACFRDMNSFVKIITIIETQVPSVLDMMQLENGLDRYHKRLQLKQQYEKKHKNSNKTKK